MSVDGQRRIENCGGSVIQGFFFFLKSSDVSYILLSFDLNTPLRTQDDDESGIANMHFLFYFNCLHDLQLGWVGKSGFGLCCSVSALVVPVWSEEFNPSKFE